MAATVFFDASATSMPAPSWFAPAAVNLGASERMEFSNESFCEGSKDGNRLDRELADQLYRSRKEVIRLSLRVEELKGSWSYRLSAPIRLAERALASLKKRWNSRKGVADAAAIAAIDPTLLAYSTSDDQRYHAWVMAYDQLSDRDLRQIENHIQTFARRPLISAAIIAPDPVSDEELLSSLRSLCNQAYRDLEIYVACSTRHAGVLTTLATGLDQRLRFVEIPDGASEPEILDIIVGRAQGEYLIAIGTDDILSPCAIYLSVCAILANPGLCVIYGDEDELDGDARRNPFFKPGWNPELILAFDYLGSAVLYRIEILRKLVGARTNSPTAEWRWDLALRMTNAVAATDIHRLPFVLCHVRPTSKPRAATGSSAVTEELARRGETATIAPRGDHLLLSRQPPETAPHVTIIIATRDRGNLLRRCLAGLLHRTEYPSFDIVIVDNDSRDPATLVYFDLLKCDSRVQLVRFAEPFNFATINNMAAGLARGEVLAFLNNDVDVITPQWLSEMVGHAVKDDVGVVGAKLCYLDDTIQHAGVVLGMFGIADHVFRGFLRRDPGPFHLAAVPQDVSAVTGACMVVRKSVYQDIGGMDETFAVELNDIDLCLKLRARGLRVIWTPNAELFHLESTTRGPSAADKRIQAERDRFRARWSPLLEDDPLFNPNLSLTDLRRVPAFPPRVQRPCIV
jgi:O-antigen biosynthesis protein